MAFPTPASLQPHQLPPGNSTTCLVKIPLTISSVSMSVDGDAHEALSCSQDHSQCVEHTAFHSTPVLTARRSAVRLCPGRLKLEP